MTSAHYVWEMAKVLLMDPRIAKLVESIRGDDEAIDLVLRVMERMSHRRGKRKSPVI